LAIVVTPVLLAVFYEFFELTTERVAPLSVLRQIAVITILPVVLGMILQTAAPAWCSTLRAPLRKFANGMFLLMVAILLVAIIAIPEMRAKLFVGWSVLLVAVIIAFGSISIGHFLGGPQKDRRSGLAIACVARNVGLAIFIASLSESQDDMIPAFLVFVLVGTSVQLAYSKWLKKLAN
jgi:BASS family bile acid:Na+ symporter